METPAIYQAGTPVTVEAFKNRPCALPKENEGYIAPTPQEVKSLRQLLKLSQRGLAKLLGVSYSDEKGSPTVRKWETGEDKASHRAINYASWRLMLLTAEVIKEDDIQKEVAEYRL